MRSWWPVDCSRLICLRMDILGQRRAVLVGHTVGWLAVLEKLQACFNVHIGRVEVRRSLIGVEGIRCLVVAGLVLLTVSTRCNELLRI